MNIINLAVPSLAVVALTELYQRVKAKDLNGSLVIVAGGVIGLAAGFLHVVGLNPVTGLVAGLMAVGIHTTGQAFAGK